MSNTFDSVVSMADFFGEVAGTIALFPNDFSGWDRADQRDAMVAKYAHWYVDITPIGL